MNLASLGLSELDESVYRALLRKAEVGGEQQAITRLVELELAHLDEDGRAVAADPEIAVPRLIKRRLRETNAEMHQISGAWEVVPALSAERASATATSHDSFERIEGAARVNDRIWSLSQDATEVLAVHHKQRQIRMDHLPRFVERLAQGVQWRTILPREHLNDAAVAEYCLRLHRAGDRHRLTDEVVQQMVILDRSVAFVPTVPNASGVGALMIRQVGAVATLVDLFERVWAHASDLEPAEQSGLTGRERQILHLVATVVKDEIAAREMGISVRTYRRHVADLLCRLEMPNRLQAAVLAKQRGWI